MEQDQDRTRETEKPSEGLIEASAEFVGHVTRNQRKLYAFIYSLLGRAADAEDVLQETNLVLWRKSSQFQLGTDFLAWSFRVAHFQVLAFRKRKYRARECFNEDLLEQLATAAEEGRDDVDVRQDALARCLAKLRPEQRQLVAQRYEPGGCVNDMAKQRGRTPKAISEALRRIRETLLRCIEKSLLAEGSP